MENQPILSSVSHIINFIGVAIHGVTIYAGSTLKNYDRGTEIASIEVL
jgi:hypothetical protein